MKKFILLLAISIWILPATLRAQCDTIASLCVKNLTAKYISDGQQYRALLLSKEVAEFNATFYGGTTYRLAACSGLKDGSLEFRIFDKQRNLLFTNIEHKNAPYWDFKFESTMDCIMEAQLIDPNVKSGCAVLLISFKK
ncbi:MAG: hypothetical protein ACK5JC_11640 [Bacteroidota bacterium]|jgi:hypothetical protein